MKIIIPVAGAGTKLRPHTYTQPKPLIPLAGKTILSFIIDQWIEQGYQDFIFVIGYLGEKIKDYVLEKYPNINASFVVQQDHSGTGYAVWLTRELIAQDEELLIIYGDTICDFDIKTVIESKHNLVGIKRVDDPREFGVVELDKEGYVKNFTEKPKIPKSNLAMVGMYKITNSSLFFDYCHSFCKAIEKEAVVHLSDILNEMLKNSIPIGTFSVNNWFDCGRKETLLETNATLLNKVEFASEEIPFFDNTIIIHPVSISNGCEIENSIIGPHVTIGEHAVIKNAIIKDSIIGGYAKIEKVVLHSSLIGGDAYICGASQSLNIGDNTEIDLSK